jgi:hypothetical protein
MRTGVIAAAVAATVAVVAAYGQPRPYRLPRTPIDAARLSHDARALVADAGGASKPRAVDARADYLIQRFKALGLKPGGESGGWTQAVPLIRYALQGPVSLTLTESSGRRPLAPGRDAAVATLRPVDRVQIDRSPLVFLGRGGDAAARLPDLSGKVALVLANPQAPGQAIDAAARRGAVGVLVVRDPASEDEASRAAAEAVAKPQLVMDNAGADAPLLQGWISREAASELFRSAGLDFAALEQRATDPGFQPIVLRGAAFSADYRVRRERVVVHNVLARLPGVGAAKETVIYSARWRPLEAGAQDDGTSLAALLELARVYAHATPTRRTLVFAAFADDPHGHFGADWYLDRPLYPLSATAADIDIQALQTAGPARDLVLADAARSTLADDLDRAAARQGRRATWRDSREADVLWSLDPPALARKGVPVLPVAAASGAPDLVEGGRSAGEAWLRNHRGLSGGSAQAWDLRGAALDLALLYDVGRDVANASIWPRWKSGTTIAARRISGETVARRRSGGGAPDRGGLAAEMAQRPGGRRLGEARENHRSQADLAAQPYRLLPRAQGRHQRQRKREAADGPEELEPQRQLEDEGDNDIVEHRRRGDGHHRGCEF